MRNSFLAAPLLALGLAGCATFGSAPATSAPPAAPQRLDIPRASYPPAGQCRIWIPGVPAAQQSAPGKCADLQQRVPPNGVLVHG